MTTRATPCPFAVVDKTTGLTWAVFPSYAAAFRAFLDDCPLPAEDVQFRPVRTPQP